MHSFDQTLRIALGTFCVALASLIVGEMVLSVSDVAALPNDPPTAAASTAPLPVVDVDRLVATILDRPLFTPGRRPPPPAPAASAEAVKTAPELHARLAGMTIGPNEREALFARDGGGVLAMREKQQIDGWTVTSIDTEKVVLSSDFGDRVLRPTPGARSLAPSSRPRQAAARRPPEPSPATPSPTVASPAAQPPIAPRLPTTSAKNTNKKPRS